MTEHALTVRQSSALTPATTVRQAVANYNAFNQYVSTLFREGLHFGTIPGTDKPTLYQPGAELIRTFFNLSLDPLVDKEIEDWAAEPPFFYYRIRTVVTRDGYLICHGLGSANTREPRYAYRWRDPFSAGMTLEQVEALPPERKRKTAIYIPAFALRKRQSPEENAQYGKPASYYDMWEEAIQEGKAVADNSRVNRNGDTMEGWSMVSWSVRFLNMDTAELANTVLKIAVKRSLVDAMKRAGNASEKFTQDLEDLVEFAGDDVIDGIFEDEKPPAPAESKKQPEPHPVTEDNLREAIRELVRKMYPGSTFENEGHFTFMIKRAPLKTGKALRNMDRPELEALLEQCKEVLAQKTQQELGEEDEETPPPDLDEDIPF